MAPIPWGKFPTVAEHQLARRWLHFTANIGRAPNTIDAYGRAVEDTEIFGPVAAIVTFDDEDEVVHRPNDTPWGLVAYVFTEGLDRALRVGELLEVGLVGLNTGHLSNPAAPFGGVKQSGLGREGGRVGIEEFLECRYLAVPVC